jgi:hypothetical protein
MGAGQGVSLTRPQGGPLEGQAAHLRDRSNFGAVAHAPYARTPIRCLYLGALIEDRSNFG